MAEFLTFLFAMGLIALLGRSGGGQVPSPDQVARDAAAKLPPVIIDDDEEDEPDAFVGGSPEEIAEHMGMTMPEFLEYLRTNGRYMGGGGG